jgi:excisionase family DNA binding protein
MSGGRRQEPGDTLEMDLIERAIAGIVRKQVDLALKERLPELLRTDQRRGPQLAGGPATSPLDPSYLTRQQVAQVTGYSSRTIARLIDNGKLRACGPRRDRITRFEVDRMMAKRDEIGAEETGVDPINPDADIDAEVERLTGGK